MTIKPSKNKPRYRTSEKRRESSPGQRQPMTATEQREAEAAFAALLQQGVNA